jgi:hypothetical protein
MSGTDMMANVTATLPPLERTNAQIALVADLDMASLKACI